MMQVTSRLQPFATIILYIVDPYDSSNITVTMLSIFMKTRFTSLMTILILFATVFLSSITSAMTDKATGIMFPATKNGLHFFGVGVRKKGPIKVYSVAMYCTQALKNRLSEISRSKSSTEALQTLCTGAKEDDTSCTFLLQMAFKVGADKMASAISDSVSPRHKGDRTDVDKLRKILSNGIPSETGACKGTALQFDCSNEGVYVAINGKSSGSVNSAQLAKAFCDVYLDDNCVSPALRQSCLDNCCAE